VDAEDVTRLRMALGRISTQVERQVSAGVLSRTQLGVLGTVARNGPMRVSDLAELESINPTMLSRIIGKLEAAQLLRRESDPADGRAVRVAVTPAGARLNVRLRDERTKLFAARLADMSPADVVLIETALPALEALAEQLKVKR
jgi:DNA-binding MarR family transcriptional regulator